MMAGSLFRITASKFVFVVLMSIISAQTLVAQDPVPTPADDIKMLHAFRAQTLMELGLTEDYDNYQKAKASFPRQSGITSDEDKRRWIFTLAIHRLQLEFLGIPISQTSTTTATAKAGLGAILSRIFKTFTPGQIQTLSPGWTSKVSGESDTRLDPTRAQQVSADGESAAHALLKEYVSSERAAAYDTASPMQQADMLLEAGEAVLVSRSWPTAYILFLNDTSGAIRAERFVKDFLGTGAEDYSTWPRMTDRQRGAAAKRAILAAFDASRRLAQGRINLDEWQKRMGEGDPFKRGD